MKEMRNEIVRVGRLEKVKTMRLEWDLRMRLDEERRVEKCQREK